MLEHRKLTAVPADVMNPRLHRHVRHAVISALIVGVLAGPVALIVATRHRPGSVETSSSSPTQVSAFAETVAVAWLAGGCTELPVAVGVDGCFGRPPTRRDTPIGHDSLALYSTDVGLIPSSGGDVLDVYHSTFQYRSDGRFFRLIVPVTLTRITAGGARFPVLAAGVTVLPASLAPTGRAPAAIYRSHTAATISPAVAAKIELWADAFAADDRAALRLIVNGGPDGFYPGLGDATVERVTTGSIVEVGDGVGYVRVSVVFARTGSNGWWSHNDFDLLITETNTPDPRIVAWGPAASGPTLIAYENNHVSG